MCANVILHHPPPDADLIDTAQCDCDDNPCDDALLSVYSGCQNPCEMAQNYYNCVEDYEGDIDFCQDQVPWC